MLKGHVSACFLAFGREKTRNFGKTAAHVVQADRLQPVFGGWSLPQQHLFSIVANTTMTQLGLYPFFQSKFNNS